MDRKYWGPFCPLIQESKDYVHVAYPPARGIIKVLGSTPREMTSKELDSHFEDMYDHLSKSFSWRDC